MDDEPTASTETDINISVGGSVTGEIEVEGDVDYIAVELVAGVTYQIDLEGSRTGSGSLLDPFITGIFNGSNVSVAPSNDDGGVVTNSRIIFTPTVSGTYYIGASHFDNVDLIDIGTYTLYVEEEALSTRPDPIVALNGVSTTGNDLIDGLTANAVYAPGDDGIVHLTYSYPQSDAVFFESFDLDDGGPDLTLSNVPASAAAISIFESGLAYATAITNIDFTFVAENGNDFGILRLSGNSADSGNVLGIAAFPSELPSGSDAFLFESFIDNDELSFVTLHELGHALGITHPTDEFPADFAGVEFTLLVPSFTSAFFPTANRVDFYPTSFSYADILTLRQLYGADTNANSGDNTYSFDLGSKYFETLFDLGGTDTIKITGTGGSVSIDLTPNADFFGGAFINVGTTITYSNGFQVVGTRSDTVFVSPETIIENVIAADGNDVVIGNSADNNIQGSAGDDSLSGADGADRLLGQDGADMLIGGADNDFISGGTGDDVASGGAGDDEIFAGAGDLGNDIFIGDAGDDILGGGAGDDLIIGGGQSGIAALSSTGSSTADDGADVLFGGAGNDTLIGGSYNDINANGAYDEGEAVQTGTEANGAYAGLGDDLVIGAGGADTLGGGTGNDTLIGGDGNDTFYGGPNEATNNSLNDVIMAGNGDDFAGAGSGDDSVEGGAGDDTLFGAAGSDTINGGDGADEIFGGSGDDMIDGGGGGDEIFNSSGNDVVSGGAGDDTLRGNAGNDTLTGDAGADVFIFKTGDGHDNVTDFEIGEDTLQLNNTSTDFTDLASVQAAATDVTINGVSGTWIDTGGGDSVFLAGISTIVLREIDLILD